MSTDRFNLPAASEYVWTSDGLRTRLTALEDDEALAERERERSDERHAPAQVERTLLSRGTPGQARAIADRDGLPQGDDPAGAVQNTAPVGEPLPQSQWPEWKPDICAGCGHTAGDHRHASAVLHISAGACFRCDCNQYERKAA